MIRIAALYCFTDFSDPDVVREGLLAVCRQAGAKGTLLLAAEGINGTVAASPEGIEAVLTHIRALPGCADLDVKDSYAEIMPFHRLRVRLKKEIVTLGVPGLDARDAGTYVEPQDWDALIARPDVVTIDTRNIYEVAIGTFEGAVDPGTASFTEFPDWFRSFRQTLPKDDPPKIAMFCTGGIRCEKATAFLKSEGVEEVFHLKGGVLKYLETMAPDAGLWRGECFVFDQRAAVGPGLAPGVHVLCHGCRRPVGAEDQASPLFQAGVQCPACHEERSQGQRDRYAERHKQTERAQSLGLVHVGAVMQEEKRRKAAEKAQD